MNLAATQCPFKQKRWASCSHISLVSNAELCINTNILLLCYKSLQLWQLFQQGSNFTPLSLFSDLSSLLLSQPSCLHTISMSVIFVWIHLQKISIKIPGCASIMHHLWPCCTNGLGPHRSGFVLKPTLCDFQCMSCNWTHQCCSRVQQHQAHP